MRSNAGKRKISLRYKFRAINFSTRRSIRPNIANRNNNNKYCKTRYDDDVVACVASRRVCRINTRAKHRKPAGCPTTDGS